MRYIKCKIVGYPNMVVRRYILRVELLASLRGNGRIVCKNSTHVFVPWPTHGCGPSAPAMLNYACKAGEAGKAGDGNTAAFMIGGRPRWQEQLGNHRSGSKHWFLASSLRGFASHLVSPCDHLGTVTGSHQILFWIYLIAIFCQEGLQQLLLSVCSETLLPT